MKITLVKKLIIITSIIVMYSCGNDEAKSSIDINYPQEYIITGYELADPPIRYYLVEDGGVSEVDAAPGEWQTLADSSEYVARLLYEFPEVYGVKLNTESTFDLYFNQSLNPPSLELDTFQLTYTQEGNVLTASPDPLTMILSDGGAKLEIPVVSTVASNIAEPAFNYKSIVGSYGTEERTDEEWVQDVVNSQELITGDTVAVWRSSLVYE